jgi:cysteine desulfurase
MHLDLKGICISVGSACSAGAMEPSHVLLALGLDKLSAKSSIRISMGFETTEEEVDFTIDVINEVVNKIRNK